MVKIISLVAFHVTSITASLLKNPEKRIMEVIEPLRMTLVVTYSYLTRSRVKGTYTLPVAKVMVSPILTFLEICIFHMTGRGRMSITTSVIMFMSEAQRYQAFILIQ